MQSIVDIEVGEKHEISRVEKKNHIKFVVGGVQTNFKWYI